jgi:hypothetical protein
VNSGFVTLTLKFSDGRSQWPGGFGKRFFPMKQCDHGFNPLSYVLVVLCR